jgi:ribosome-associated protein
MDDADRAEASEPSIDTVRGWVEQAALAAVDKSGRDPVVLDVGDVLSITGWFLIVDGSGERQVKTIVDENEQRVFDVGGPRPLRVEGHDTRLWVLMDYGDFLVHVFTRETRRYYELERLWSDVPRLELEGLLDIGRP